ncbi:MAG: hypothetical protein UH850_00010 [Paludibacteraceae bacterium]|nr:hypothetical protein [Paludibacteraceae bacterium]
MEKWKEIISLIVSLVGTLTAFFKMSGFKKGHEREKAYYENILKPFVVEYKRNDSINAVEFLSSRLKRSDDNVPKYIFFLYDNKGEDSLKKVMLYDYFDLYRNDENTMVRIMKGITKAMQYLLFGLTLVFAFYASFFFGSAILSIIFIITNGLGKPKTVFNDWNLIRDSFLQGALCLGLSYLFAFLVKIMNDDRYTLEKRKIKKLISKKEKSYDKHKERYIY